MARRYGVAPSRAWLAGLYHDYCREWTPGELRSLALRFGKSLTPREDQNPLLIHGWAAARVLQESGRISDAGIIEAVTHHVEGDSSLEPLGQIIYAADYLEPGRTFHFRDEQNLYLSKTLTGLYEWVDQSLRAYYK
jgi:nicotinate-nucleotide adenylyltransferase